MHFNVNTKRKYKYLKYYFPIVFLLFVFVIVKLHISLNISEKDIKQYCGLQHYHISKIDNMITQVTEILPKITSRCRLINVVYEPFAINFNFLYKSKDAINFSIILKYRGSIKKPWRKSNSFDIQLLIPTLNDNLKTKDIFRISTRITDKIIAADTYFFWCEREKVIIKIFKTTTKLFIDNNKIIIFIKSWINNNILKNPYSLHIFFIGIGLIYFGFLNFYKK